MLKNDEKNSDAVHGAYTNNVQSTRRSFQRRQIKSLRLEVEELMCTTRTCIHTYIYRVPALLWLATTPRKTHTLESTRVRIRAMPRHHTI